jgi:hypothetical protein
MEGVGRRGRVAVGWECYCVQTVHETLGMKITLRTLQSDNGSLKGTVSRDFLLQVFFMKHLPPSP